MGTDYTNKSRLVTNQHASDHISNLRRPQIASQTFWHTPKTSATKFQIIFCHKNPIIHCGSIKIFDSQLHCCLWSQGFLVRLYSSVNECKNRYSRYLSQDLNTGCWFRVTMWFLSSRLQTSPSDLTRTMLNLSIFRSLFDVLQCVKCFANYLGGLAGVACCF